MWRPLASPTLKSPYMSLCSFHGAGVWLIHPPTASPQTPRPSGGKRQSEASLGLPSQPHRHSHAVDVRPVHALVVDIRHEQTPLVSKHKAGMAAVSWVVRSAGKRKLRRTDGAHGLRVPRVNPVVKPSAVA